MSYLDNITEFEDGSLEIPLAEGEDGEEAQQQEEDEQPFTPNNGSDLDAIVGVNLADNGFVPHERMSLFAQEILDGFIDDLDSNRDYFETLRKGVDLLGIKMQGAGELGNWSCGATHPLLIENAIKLQAMASTELDPPDGPCKTRIFGASANPEAEAIAKRKQDYMNWMLSYKSDTFYPESNKTWLLTALFGTAFKANYWGSKENCVHSQSLRPDQCIVNKSVKTLTNCDRYTCIIPSSEVEVADKMRDGYFKKTRLDVTDVDSFTEGEDYVEDIFVEHSEGGSIETTLQLEEKLDEIVGSTHESDRVLLYTYVKFDANRLFYTQEEEDEFQGDGKYVESLYLPFLLITELKSRKVLGFYANWKQGDASYSPLSYVTDYHLIRGFGFYSLGYVHILGNFQRMLTSIMRSIVDSGTLANLQGGFKLKGVKIAGTKRIAPGEFIEVETPTGDISKAIMNLGFKEPSTIMTQMYQLLEGRGQMFANATEGVVKDSTNYGKVGTTLALLDASSKLTTAIIRDFHRQRRRELEVIHNLIKDNVTEYPYDIDGVKDKAKQFDTDFRNEAIEILPVSDPNVPNNAERMTLAQQRITFAQQFPQVHDLRATLSSVYKTMGVENPDIFLPQPQQAQPQDPMSDILTAVRGQPIGAFPGQAHEAYITVFNNWVQLPEVIQNVGLTPAVGAVTAVMQQHMVLSFKERTEGLMQQDPSTANVKQDPNITATLQAAASQRVLMAEQQMQKQGGGNNLDALKALTLQTRAQIEAKKADSNEIIQNARLALDQQKLKLEEKKLALQEDLGNNKIIADLSNKDAQRRQDEKTSLAQGRDRRVEMALDLLKTAAQQQTKEKGKEEKGDK